jgi:hypothetical protein
VWFDVPEECRDELSETGNPWLLLIVPLAMSSGEDITLPFPVDSNLLENVQGMMRFWHSSYSDLKPARINTVQGSGHRRSMNRRGIYFSGGIDSTFSLLRHDKSLTGCGSGTVDDLIFVAGLDVPISDRAEVELTQKHLGRVAAAHDKNLIRIDTNLKQLDTPYRGNWLLFYGCALGAAGHLLDGRFGELIISAGHCYGERPLTGSHPITDPLLSSRQLRFVHDGASFTRVEKTEQIALAGDPLQSVRVCWESKRHDNCSRCGKCLLTMATLDLAGYRNRAECFDWSAYRIDDLRSLFLADDTQVIFFREVVEDARKRGRTDVEEVVTSALRTSLRARKIIGRVRRIPVIWRLESHIRRLLLPHIQSIRPTNR